ncbi:DUF2569 domain-containing protein [Massilia antarctica]|uniref:DUF2569 domain-containing protein n=1 Tax=Massilia antarctica TaxID=2765360 RepID=UPI0006BE039C|nr:DUF2569 domain-containing protein [Massilia sp. H27-R4]CUI03851.1 hypothetical protein BN2497_2479 [Janthinobacterium sp. CG23_2]CUU27637.1 hypothetical protein BN3177_2479 [Janthinobacterium sp. CG23_2]
MSELKNDVEGLKGWLLIVGMVVLFTPLRALFTFPAMYMDLFDSTSWVAMTTPGNGAYHSAWKPLVFTEVAFNGGMFVVSLLLIYLFFAKKRGFPMLFIVLHVTDVLLTVCQSMIIHLILPAEPLFDLETGTELVRSLLVALIWVPYLLVSERVERTFVE